MKQLLLFLLCLFIVLSCSQKKTVNQELKSSYGQFRSAFNPTKTGVINIIQSDTLTITCSKVTRLSSDTSFVISWDVPVYADSLLIPNDGYSYWYIPFNNSLEPIQMAVGYVDISCCCNTSKCCKTYGKIHEQYCYACSANPCQICQTTIEAFGGLPSGIILKAESFKYNGTYYQ